MLILKTWLQYLTDLDFFGLFMKIIRSIFLALDGIIYAIISYCYEVFTFISEIRVFENEDMVNLANRIYILIGVVSLFLVAYTLLNAIINPENATKDKNKSFTGIVKNIILAIIGIAIVPTVFDYAYEFQSRVLCNNVIQKFFLENNITEDDDARTRMGTQMSLYLFKSFYYIKGSEDDTSLDENANSNWETMAQSIVSDSDDSYNLSMAFSDIELGNRSISEALGDFDDSIDSGKLGYLFLISTLAGAFCAYVILGFVIDMGVRAVKLAYLQLIAPLPILTLILPNQKKVFDNWLKKTSSCFIEVFTRIIAMSFAFYAIKYLRPWIFNDMSSVSCGRTVEDVTKLLAQAAFIVGVFAFLKQLPKFIKDLLPGFDSAGFKLGFGNAFAEAGGFQALGMAGGAITSGVRNMAVEGRKVANEYNKPLGRFGKIGRAVRVFKAEAGMLASTLAGATSGGARSLVKGKDAKKWSDSVKFAGEGADEAMEAKLKRQEYKDTHGGTIGGVIGGHAKDVIDKIKDYPKSYEAEYKHLQNVLKPIKETADAQKSMTDAAKNYVENHEKDITVDDFKFTDAQGVTHQIRGNTDSLLKLRQYAEDAEKVANSTGNISDIEYARSVKNQYEAAKKAAQMGALSGRFNTNQNGISKNEIDSGIFATIQSYHSYITKNRDTILNNSGLDRNSAEFTNLSDSLDTIIGLDLSSNDLRNAANQAAFRTFEEQLKRKTTINGQEIEIGSFIATTTAKDNVTAQSNALLDKIKQQESKK